MRRSRKQEEGGEALGDAPALDDATPIRVPMVLVCPTLPAALDRPARALLLGHRLAA